jgi:hypothetical protein
MYTASCFKLRFYTPTPTLPRWGREFLLLFQVEKSHIAPPPSGGRLGGGPER